MEMQQLKENTWIYDTRSNLLLASILIHRVEEDSVVLIDTGCGPCDELFEELDRRGWRVRAAICTHLHWDHTFNNEEVHRRHGVILASLRESFPYISGAPHHGEYVTVTGGNIVTIAGKDFRLIPTSGHTPGHVSVVTPDNICHMGDAVMSPPQLAIAKLPFMEETRTAIESLDLLRNSSCDLYVAAHSGVITPEELPGVLDLNLQKEHDIYDALVEYIDRPMDITELSVGFIKSLGITRSHVVDNPAWHRTVKQRLFELLRMNRIARDGYLITPVKKD